MTGFSQAQELVIEILSDRIVENAGEPERGIPLRSVVLRRQVTGSSDEASAPQVLSQPRGVGPWYMDDRKLYDQVLQSPETLQRLYITGGEPLINDRVTDILNFLIDRGASQHIDLEFSTNCTRVDPNTIERLTKFRKVDLFLSIDAVGSTYEYIRYPARWNIVDANVQKLVRNPTLTCQVTPVVQAYNVLRLVDLYRYCDALNLTVFPMMLNFPNRLAIDNLPERIRKAAAANLRAYLKTQCRPDHKSAVSSLVDHLNGVIKPPDPAILKEFMVFTNDLDATRDQNFRTAHPEFVGLLAQDGFDWVEDNRYLHNTARKPAAERIYASL